MPFLSTICMVSCVCTCWICTGNSFQLHLILSVLIDIMDVVDFSPQLSGAGSELQNCRQTC